MEELQRSKREFNFVMLAAFSRHYNMALVKSVFLPSDLIFFSYAFIIFSSCLVYSNKASEIRRPRGVSISKASLYIPDKDFTCFDGSNTIPFTQVNDDYCDCPDGSDEPGTSACPNSFFHCTNAGFRPMYIPSSQVNDGICDCCDGADEYSGKIECVNVCHELGKAERVEAQKRAEIAKIGNEARLQAIKKGKQLKQEKQEKLQQLENDKLEAENIKLEKEKLKSEVEELEKVALEQYRKVEELEQEKRNEEERKAAEQEALDIFNMLDSNQDKKLQVSEIQARQTFDQNKDGIVSDDEAKFYFDNADEMDYETYLISGWPRMKPFFMLDKGLFTPPRKDDSEVDDLLAEEGDGVGSVEDVTNEYQKERQHEPPQEENEEEEEEDEELEEEEEQEHHPEDDAEHKTEDHSPQYDEETQKLVDAANEARSEFDEADRAVRDIQREISQLEEYLEKDYGPDEEFAPLEGDCFEYTDREYLYKLCPFDQASQQPRSGGSETRLGVWSRWAGPEDDKYQAMLYDKGQSCWNGPQRSTYVKIKCGIENALISVSEPNKCEYHFEFTTPSACRIVDGLDERPHDEL